MSNLSIKHLNDKKSIFKVNKSSLENRWDPQQFHIERAQQLFKLSSCSTKKLKKLFYSKSVQVTESDEPYVGLENVESGTGVYVGSIEKTTFSSAKKFKKGNVLFPKLRPYLNKVYLAEFDGVCSTEFYVFDSKSEVINDFLAIYLRSNLIVNQTKHLMTGNTLPRLQTEDVNNLQVPNISYHVQELIVENYKVALNLRKRKLIEVKEKLASIDTYLLEKLGLLKSDFNAINLEYSNVFIQHASSIFGKRQDPDYYHQKYKHILELINRSTFSLLSLKECCLMIKSGKTPASKDYSTSVSNFPVVKVGSYLGDFIDFRKQAYAINEQPYEVSKGDIFILSAAHQAEYVGRHIKYLNEIPEKVTSFVGELICIRADEKTIKSELLFSVLNLDIFKILINREKRGQTSHIYPQDIRNICIPIPPMDIQNDIVEYIQQIRDEAKKLESEANLVLENAKQEIEKMILGETV